MCETEMNRYFRYVGAKRFGRDLVLFGVGVGLAPTIKHSDALWIATFFGGGLLYLVARHLMAKSPSPQIERDIHLSFAGRLSQTLEDPPLLLSDSSYIRCRQCRDLVSILGSTAKFSKACGCGAVSVVGGTAGSIHGASEVDVYTSRLPP